jgi:hypothetical protein
MIAGIASFPIIALGGRSVYSEKIAIGKRIISEGPTAKISFRKN